MWTGSNDVKISCYEDEKVTYDTCGNLILETMHVCQNSSVSC